jgi:hypothetical protein
MIKNFLYLLMPVVKPVAVAVPAPEIKFNGELPLTVFSADSICAVFADKGAKNVHIEKRKIDAATVLTFPLQASGRVAVQIKAPSINNNQGR